MNQEVYHIPALLSESIKALNIRTDGVYVDATYGGGGHSKAIVERLNENGHLYSFDQDEDAIANALTDSRFTMVYGNFRFLRNFLRYYGVDAVDGILADLGVSFHHFDDASRGFSFRTDSVLDMRMNRHASRTAADLLNSADEDTLAEIFRLYGELPKARLMARAIVRQRSHAPINTVDALVGAISAYIDKRREKKELSCVFQALRIEINGELDALREFLQQAADALRPGGRLAVITYHSLEDRLVKNLMKTGNFEGKVETDLFGRSSHALKMLNSKPIVASESEIAANPRSRSAKLRVAVKL